VGSTTNPDAIGCFSCLMGRLRHLKISQYDQLYYELTSKKLPHGLEVR